MLKNIMLPVLLLAAVPAVAQADEHAQQLDYAGTGLGWYGMYVDEMQKRGTSSGVHDDPSQCTAVVDKYENIIGPDEKIASRDFKVVASAVEVPDSGHPAKWAIPFKDARSLCQRYAELRTLIVAVKPLEDIYETTPGKAVREVAFEELDWYAAGKAGTGMGGSQTDIIDSCNTAIDTAIAAGARADIPVQFGQSTDLTLDQLRARCQKQQEVENAYAEKASAWVKAKYASVVAKYKAVGIKGDRLDLFVWGDNLGGWLLPGCMTTVVNPKQLKKAKKLFDWLTTDDGTITVRKYTLKGDKYRISEKQYDREDDAYKGCK